MALHNFIRLSLFTLIVFLYEATFSQQASSAFSWPKGKRAAVSLSFDDARVSQPDSGIALLDHYGIKATFFVVPSGVKAAT